MSEKPVHTKDILAAELTKAALPEMAAKAATGYYHDFLSPLATPGTQLAADLRSAGTPPALALLERHMRGEFDASRAESAEWSRTQEGREMLGHFGTGSEAPRGRSETSGGKGGPGAPPTHVRLRTASDRKKAMQQYDELRRGGRVARALVIAELKDGSWQVLGQGMSPEEIAQSLVVAADALAQVEQRGKEVRPEARIEPERRGEHNKAAPRPRQITTAADGTLVPPPGENFISCGECNHPRWFVLHLNDADRQSRMACTHCGNEVVSIPIHHAEGTA